MAIAKNHITRADSWFGCMLGTEGGFDEIAGTVIKSPRRNSAEEGFGDAWPVLIVRKKAACWISAATESLASINAFLARNPDRKDDWWRDYQSSFIYLPSEQMPTANADDVGCIRPITLASRPPGYAVPEESIRAGTAFGVFVDDKLVSWCEATPLQHMTPKYGIMIPGVETYPEHRGKGYAKATLARVTQEVCSRNMTPVYFCHTSNVASQKTALACGYELYGEWWRYTCESVGALFT